MLRYSATCSTSTSCSRSARSSPLARPGLQRPAVEHDPRPRRHALRVDPGRHQLGQRHPDVGEHALAPHHLVRRGLVDLGHLVDGEVELGQLGAPAQLDRLQRLQDQRVEPLGAGPGRRRASPGTSVRAARGRAGPAGGASGGARRAVVTGDPTATRARPTARAARLTPAASTGRRTVRASRRGSAGAGAIVARRAECAAVFADRVHRARGGHAHLRLRRLDGGRRSAGHPGRAALLRPVHRARPPAHRAARLGGRAVRGRVRPAAARAATTSPRWPRRSARPAGPTGRSSRRRPAGHRAAAGTCGAARARSRATDRSARLSGARCASRVGPPARVPVRDGPVRDREGLRHPRCRRRAARRADWCATSARRWPALLRAEGAGASGRRSATTCATARPSWPPRSPRASPGRASTSSTIGLASTDMLYFASGTLDLPGAMFTASHNPAQLQRHQALPRRRRARSARTPGWPTIRARRRGRACRPGPGGGTVTEPRPARRATPPTCASWSTCAASGRCGSWSTPATAWAAHRAGGARRPLPLDVVPMYFELDGSFPNHEANPLDPANLVDLQKRVRRGGRRHRAGLRRRRRPLLRRRRARRAGEPERDHRAGRGPRAGQGARARR